MSNFKVTLTEAVPDTGLFTSTDNSSGIAIGAGALILLFAAIATVWALVAKRRNHRNFQSGKFHLRTAKRTILGLFVLTVMVGTFSLAISRQSKETSLASATDGTTTQVSSTGTGDGDTTNEAMDALSISVSNFELAVVPKEDGTFGYGYQTVTVNTPTDAGYVLSAYASSENLVNSENEQSVISGMEATAGTTALDTNTWGMSLEKPEDSTSEVWSKMPSTAETATIVDYVGSATKKDNESNIYYGVNVNKDLAYGDYTNTIVYVAIANMSISDIDYMQEFANLSYVQNISVRNSMTEGEQYALKDSRDEKTYYVSKLADGNVWMTQNLDLDIDSTKTYTPADTDVTTSWAPSASTIEFVTGSTINGWTSSDTTPESADPGDVYYYTSNSSTIDATFSSLSACLAGEHTEEECAHYQAGNYYNWPAAVAMNDTSDLTIQYYNVNSSICPAGWRLPNNRRSSGSATIGNEQLMMLSSYDNILGDYSPDAGVTGGQYSYLEGGFNTIRINPLWLVRSGAIYTNAVNGNAKNGYYWSSTTNGDDSAYLLYFGSNSVTPAVNNSNRLGYSVRCILRTEPPLAQ